MPLCRVHTRKLFPFDNILQSQYDITYDLIRFEITKKGRLCDVKMNKIDDRPGRREIKSATLSQRTIRNAVFSVYCDFMLDHFATISD